jgi:hypothetical protein
MVKSSAATLGTMPLLPILFLTGLRAIDNGRAARALFWLRCLVAVVWRRYGGIFVFTTLAANGE